MHMRGVTDVIHCDVEGRSFLKSLKGQLLLSPHSDPLRNPFPCLQGLFPWVKEIDLEADNSPPLLPVGGSPKVMSRDSLI